MLPGAGGRPGPNLQSLLPTEPRQNPQQPQPQQPQQNQGPRFPLQLKPMERDTLQALLSSGIIEANPDFAMQVLSGVQDAMYGRQDMRRENYQEKQASLESLLPQIEQDVASQWQAGVPQEAVEAGYSEYGPAVQKSLDDMIQGTYGSGAATAGVGMTGEDMAALQQSAAVAAQRQTQVRMEVENGVNQGLTQEEAYQQATSALETPGPTTLHDLRMEQMTVARAAGYSPEMLQQIYDILGGAFERAGGDPGDAPLTSMAQMGQAPTMTPTAPPPAMPPPTPALTPTAAPPSLGAPVPMRAPSYVAPSLRDLFQRP